MARHDAQAGAAPAYPGQARHAQVVHTLGAAIVRGELGPGHPVPTEDELVSRLAVGRSALREGVKVLAGKGLLESRTSAGTRVRPRESWNLLDPDVLRWRYHPHASPADIATLADLRVVLEPGAARLAAEHASPAQRGAVAAAMARLWATVAESDEFIAADLAFHRAVFAACGNDLLLYIHDVVSVALGAIRPLHTHSVAHNRETLPAHQQVAQAIGRGHHRKAEAAMREIVEGARADALTTGEKAEAAMRETVQGGQRTQADALTTGQAGQ
jgi:DNA-binding FadR family transcriptional regulator